MPEFIASEIRHDVTFGMYVCISKVILGSRFLLIYAWFFAGFWFNIFQMVILELPNNFFKKQMARAYGLHCHLMIHYLTEQFEQTLLSGV